MADQLGVVLIPRQDISDAPEAGPAVEAAQAHERSEPEWSCFHFHAATPVASTHAVPVHQMGLPPAANVVSMYSYPE